MMQKISLPDAMAIQVGCTCLSDLHFVDDHQRLHLARTLEKIPL